MELDALSESSRQSFSRVGSLRPVDQARRLHSGGGLIESDEAISSMLKTLVDPSGLKAMSSRTHQRLVEMEGHVEESLRMLRALPAGYCERAADHEEMLYRHTEGLKDHQTDITTLQHKVSQLSVFPDKFTESMEMLDSCVGRVDRCEAKALQQQEALDKVSEKLWGSEIGLVDLVESLQTQHAALVEQVEAANLQIQQHSEQIYEMRHGSYARKQAASQVEALRSSIHDEMIEALSQSWSEIDRASRPSHIEKALHLIDKELVKVLRTNLEKAVARMQSFASQAEDFREQLGHKVKLLEQRVEAVTTSHRKAESKLMIELDSRTRKTEFNRLETTMNTGVHSLQGSIDNLNERVTVKLSEFVDHFSKIQGMLSDHEHCLVHHAEEIENRPSKYDLLICQDFVEACASKEEVDRELRELKQLTSWQTGKIESFEITASMMKKGGGAGLRRPRGGGQASVMTSALSSRRGTLSNIDMRSSRPSLRSEASGEVAAVAAAAANADPPSAAGSAKGDEPRQGSHTQITDGVREDAAAEEEEEANVERQGTEVADPDTESRQVDPLSLLHGSLDMAALSEDSEAGNDPLIKTQIETLACALVGLGQLVLQEPRLGLSRQARLERERDFLRQLTDLRHWITHRQLPPGWSPDLLVTAALRAANAAEDRSTVRAIPQSKVLPLEKRGRHKSVPSGSLSMDHRSLSIHLGGGEVGSPREIPGTARDDFGGMSELSIVHRHSIASPAPRGSLLIVPSTAPAQTGAGLDGSPRRGFSPGTVRRRPGVCMSAREVSEEIRSQPLPPLSLRGSLK